MVYGLAPPLPQNGWPPINELALIPSQYLLDALVTDTMSYVKTVVPAELLAIPTSTYIDFGDVIYHGDGNANCNWATTGCFRTTSGPWGQPDLYECSEIGLWGLSYDDSPCISVDSPCTPELLTN